MGIVAQNEPKELPVPASRRCPICPDLTTEIACYMDFERGILRDLREARLAGSDDAEVLEADAAYVRRHIDGLIVLAARAARP